MCVKGMFSSYTSVLHTSNPDCGPRSERSHSLSIHYMSCYTGNISYFFSCVIFGINGYRKLSPFRPLHVTFNCRRDRLLWEKTPANQEAEGKHKGPILYLLMDRGYRWMTHFHTYC